MHRPPAAQFKRKVLESVIIEGVQLFDKLALEAQEELISRLVEVTYQAGDIILEQGAFNDSFFIIKSGVARVQQAITPPSAQRLSRGNSSTESLSRQGSLSRQASGTAAPSLSRQSSSNSSVGASASPRFKDVAQLQSGDTFGERSLLFHEPTNARISVWKLANQKPLVCYTLDRATFEHLLGDSNEASAVLTHLVQSRESGLGERVRFDDLDVRRILGVGTFGRVKLAVHKPTGKPYALKCMRKAQIIENKMTSHVLAEKRILGMVSHPFILELVGTYQDAGELYMLEELGLGGELFSVLQKQGALSDAATRFYTASVIATFTHLHSLKVIYRDLKPENLLLDERGYLLLVDFGMAKVPTITPSSAHTQLPHPP